MIRKIARMLGKLWTWGIIITLALGLVGQLVRDRTLWLALLMYLPILPVGVVGLVQDLVQKGRAMPRVRFGLSMLAMAAVFWNLSQMTGSGRGVVSSNDARDEIRLVQWNVMWGTRDKAERWNTVIEDIAAHKPDIVILSEGPYEPFRNMLLQRLGPEWNAAVSKNSIQTPGYWYNMVICSRWPVREFETRAISTGRILRARIDMPSGVLHVLEVDGMSDPRLPRRGRMQDVARVVREAQERGDPIDIIAGDFNAVSRSVGYEAIQSAGSGFARASDRAGWRGTWPSVCPLYDIDHVLVGARWETVSCGMFANRYLDHRGQVVVMRPLVTYKRAGLRPAPTK